MKIIDIGEFGSTILYREKHWNQLRKILFHNFFNSIIVDITSPRQTVVQISTKTKYYDTPHNIIIIVVFKIIFQKLAIL